MTTLKSVRQLETRIEKYQAEINRLQQLLEEANLQNSAKSGYLGYLAHELRTPLNTVIGFSQILYRHTQATEEQKEYLHLILMSGEHLLSLIEDILQMTQIEAGEVRLNPIEFDLYELIHEVESIYLAAAIKKGIHFDLRVAEATPRYINADRTKIQQILNNLLSNALKFTNQGVVSLEIHPSNFVDETQSARLHVSVSDTGTGIKKDELQKLFQPYRQTTSGIESHKGTGLGLTITREFVRLMGGDIEVESEWQEGTTFTVHMCVEVKPEQAPTAKIENRVNGIVDDGTIYRILVVDDHEDQRTLLKDTLSKVGFEVEVEADGVTAIQIWKSWKPHLILMDMRMAYMSGYVASQYIREMDVDETVKIIALTGSAYEAEEGTEFITICDDFLQKPLNLTDLFNKIEAHLELQFTYDTNDMNLIETQIAQAVYPIPDIDVLEQDLQHRLKVAASDYSLERIQEVVSDFPSPAEELRDFIMGKAIEFDFKAILALFTACSAR